MSTITVTTVSTATATLVAAVKHALLAVAKRPTVPVMGHLWLGAESGTLAVSGFDWETRVTSRVDAAGDLSPVLVPGTALRDALTRLDQKVDVTMALDGDRLVITQGTRTVTLKTGDLDDYPTLPPVPVAMAFETTGYNLAALWAGVGPCVSNDDMLPVLTATHLILEDQTLYAETTDRFRLAVMHHLVLSHVKDFEALVPNMATVAAVMGKDDHVTVSIDNGTIFFTTRSAVISQRLTDGTFPKVRQLFPPEANTITRFAPEAFLSALKFVQAGVRKNEAVYMTVAEGALTMSATNDDGETTDRVTATVVGEDLDTGFNPALLADAVKVFGKTDEVRMLSTVGTKPSVFEADSIPTLRVLVMPRRKVS